MLVPVLLLLLLIIMCLIVQFPSFTCEIRGTVQTGSISGDIVTSCAAGHHLTGCSGGNVNDKVKEPGTKVEARARTKADLNPELG